MARARNIKPGFFKNERLPDLPFQGRLLFIGLWTIADREGRLEYRPRKIKAELFPYEECPVEEFIHQLSALGFLLMYEVSGTTYIQIHNWSKHQKPHHKEVESVIQGPPAALIPSSLIPDSLIPDSGSTAQEAPVEPPFITLTLNDKSEFPITEARVAEWALLYPAVNVPQELRKMRGWCDSNAPQRKTKRGILAFVTRWLAKEQDKSHGPAKSGGQRSAAQVLSDYCAPMAFGEHHALEPIPAK